MKRLRLVAVAGAVVAATAASGAPARASAGPPANCVGQDASALGTSDGAAFGALVAGLGQAGLVSQQVHFEQSFPLTACPG